MITRISKINKIGLFKDFKWNESNTADFTKYNVFYGWNGSGKTTISRIFDCHSKGDVNSLNFKDGSTFTLVSDRDVVFSIPPFPEKNSDTKVFNEDYINENLQWNKNKAKQLLIVGKGKIENKHELEELRTDLKEKREGKQKLEDEKTALEKNKIKLFEGARNRVIDNLNTCEDIVPFSGKAKRYRTYTITDVTEIVKLLDTGQLTPEILPEENILALKKALSEKDEKPPLDDFIVNFIWNDELLTLLDTINHTSLTSIVSDSFGKLTNDPEVSSWLRSGHELHVKNGNEECLFCGNIISKERWSDLEAYFDEQFKSLIKNINVSLQILETRNINVPTEVSNFYPELQSEVRIARDRFFARKKILDELIDETKAFLHNKMKNPFKTDHFEVNKYIAVIKSLKEDIENINIIIRQHNKKTAGFHEARKGDAHKLEISLVSSLFTEYETLRKKFTKVVTMMSELSLQISASAERIKLLEDELKDHSLAAIDFNKQLKQFLGRDEIQLKTENEGYSIIRNNEPAKHMSEGEKNAIALIFFLTSLKEEGFNPSDAIVVIDDPVSSFDSQNTYQAYSFIKAKIMEINPAQVFILTHNFGFFRRFRDWLKHVNSRDVSFYQIVSKTSEESGRFAVIKNIDPLLKEHDSEYSYLFKLVKNRADIDDTTLEKDYIFPNVIRKLLENYLSIKVPIGGMQIHKKYTKLLEDYPDYNEKLGANSKSRIESYCQDNSHPLYQDSPTDFDERLLGEMHEACKDVIQLIQETDPKHYSHLLTEHRPV